LHATSTRNRERLVDLLQLAYSGELAAAHAYRGHAASVFDPEEKLRIRSIEEEEWHHRRLLGEMLAGLHSRPRRLRELRATLIGRTLRAACRVSGWYLPMYGAGKLESGNIREYETAARFARDAGREDLADCLLTMAEVEWEHERYFREKIARHWLTRWLRLWPEPAPKPAIRGTFERWAAQAEVLRTARAAS
jgi:rubrerythrin